MVAEYLDSLTECVHCKSALVEGPAPEALKPSTDWQALTPVVSFSEVHHAYAALAALRAAGIEAEVRDDHYLGLSWHHALALGGIRILVPPGDVHAARSVLSGIDPELVELAAAQSAPLDERCPNCQSPNVTRAVGRGFNPFLNWLLLGLPRLFSKVRFVCADCGSEYVP